LSACGIVSELYTLTEGQRIELSYTHPTIGVLDDDVVVFKFNATLTGITLNGGASAPLTCTSTYAGVTSATNMCTAVISTDTIVITNTAGVTLPATASFSLSNVKVAAEITATYTLTDCHIGAVSSEKTAAMTSPAVAITPSVAVGYSLTTTISEKTNFYQSQRGSFAIGFNYNKAIYAGSILEYDLGKATADGTVCTVYSGSGASKVYSADWVSCVVASNKVTIVAAVNTAASAAYTIVVDGQVWLAYLATDKITATLVYNGITQYTTATAQ